MKVAVAVLAGMALIGGALLYLNKAADEPPDEVVTRLFSCLRTGDIEGFGACHTRKAWSIAAPIYEGMGDPQMAKRLRDRMAGVSVTIESTRIIGDSAVVTVGVRDGSETTQESLQLSRTSHGWRVDFGEGRLPRRER